MDTSFMKGQLSSCRTSSTVSCSHADSSWTPWFLPEDRRLDEDWSDGERMALEGLGGAESMGGAEHVGVVHSQHLTFDPAQYCTCR